MNFGKIVYAPVVAQLDEIAELVNGVSVLAGSAGAACRGERSARNSFQFGPELPTADIAIYARLAAANGFDGEKPRPLYLRAPDAKPQAGSRPAAEGRLMRIPFLARHPREYSHRAARRRTAAPRLRRCTARISRGPGPTANSQRCSRRTPCSALPARETGKGKAGPVGFVLARLAAGEGEILTRRGGAQPSPRRASAGS